MTSKFPDTTSSPNIFDVVFVLIVKFSYSSKFHVNIITSSWIMTISFIRNPEIENTSVWVLPNIWKLGRIRNTKLSTSISNDMLLNTAKFQGYSFYRFWVIKEKPTGGVKLTPPSPPRLELRNLQTSWANYSRILGVKNVKFAGYCFYMNTKI